MPQGYLEISVFAGNIANPLENVEITVQGDNIEKRYITDANGKIDKITLDTVDKKYTLYPQNKVIPYKKVNIHCTKEGYISKTIKNVEILEDETTLQSIFLDETYSTNNQEDIIYTEDILLFNSNEVSRNKLEDNLTTYVLDEIVIPENIIVHDGIPTNTSAPNYTVNFRDYIKNVACSEIYSTWPQETLKANVLCIISFTLNRIYTEWYKSRGYNFTITSSPAYDQKYTHGRAIFESISKVVDEIFTNYLQREGRQEPLLALYNDGIKVNKKGWFSQWGSKELGDKGYSSMQIVKYYYGADIEKNIAKRVSGIVDSYPGFDLKQGDCSIYVQKIQNQLNYIRGSYPLIKQIKNPDGIFNEDTKEAVKIFQNVFNLNQTQIVDYATWYKISYVFVAVTKMIHGIYE